MVLCVCSSDDWRFDSFPRHVVHRCHVAWYRKNRQKRRIIRIDYVITAFLDYYVFSSVLSLFVIIIWPSDYLSKKMYPYDGQRLMANSSLNSALNKNEPSSGQITIDNEPITNYSTARLRQNIGVVGQEPVRTLPVRFDHTYPNHFLDTIRHHHLWKHSLWERKRNQARHRESSSTGECTQFYHGASKRLYTHLLVCSLYVGISLMVEIWNARWRTRNSAKWWWKATNCTSSCSRQTANDTAAGWSHKCSWRFKWEDCPGSPRSSMRRWGFTIWLSVGMP